MSKRKRGLFRRDLGDHPPPLNEFLSDWHRTDYRGRMRWGLLPRVPSEEVRANARWFGKFLIGLGIAIPITIWWKTNGRFSADAILAMVGIGGVAGCCGLLLLRAGRKR